MMPDSPKPKLPRSNQIMERASALAALPSKNFYDLARDLATLHAMQPSVLIKIGDQHGISRRRMYYLSEAGAFIRKSGMDKATAERLGWTKVSALARHTKDMQTLTATEVSALVALSDQSTVYNLPEALAKNVPPPEAARAILLHLTTEQYKVVEEALAAFGARKRGRGLAGKEDALVALASKLPELRNHGLVPTF